MYQILIIEDQTYIKKTDTKNGVLYETFIPCGADHRYYQEFKNDINQDAATLVDQDGAAMTAEQAKFFVSTLP